MRFELFDDIVDARLDYFNFCWLLVAQHEKYNCQYNGKNC